ncbi:finger RFP-like [Podarcis lilfordi]|uniref:Finger RFP-like n=1 Tax=Podarcis lilfordi TaxID=74358 RepID=A0AA35JY68_9SAUR|nr:finger RFP-like [Podarcis lilfordi]
MADESPVQNLCEETTCSICLEYFTDPVTIECGHNFCQTCITQAWGNSDQDASCPQCREPRQQRNVRPNRQLASIVEIAKKFRLQMAKGAEALGKVCERHQEPLKLFCKDDQDPICVVCDKSKEHRDHKVIPKEEAFEEYQGKILRHLEFLNKQKGEIQSSKLTVETESQNLLKQTATERQKIMADFQQLHQFLEEQECLLLTQLKELDDGIKNCRNLYIARLCEEIASLNNLIRQLEEKQKQPVTEFLQNMRSILERCNENENKTIDAIAFPPGLKQQIDKFSKMHPFLEKETKKFKDVVLSGPQDEIDVVLSGPQEKKETAVPQAAQGFWIPKLPPLDAVFSGLQGKTGAVLSGLHKKEDRTVPQLNLQAAQNSRAPKRFSQMFRSPDLKIRKTNSTKNPQKPW